MISTSLSELMRNRCPFPLPRIPAKPDHVCQAGEEISRRWPDEKVAEPSDDPEALASQAERRRVTGNWRGFCWADATHVALAFLDSDLWREERFERLLDFFLGQIGPGGHVRGANPGSASLTLSWTAGESPVKGRTDAPSLP